MEADAAAAFTYIQFNFPLHLFFHYSRQAGWQWTPGGRFLVPQSKDKLPQVQSICSKHQSTMSLMQSGNTERRRGEKKKKEEKHTQAKRRFIWDDRQLTGLSLTYRRCSARRGNGPGNSCPSPRIQSGEYMAGELMDVSTGRAI